MGIGTAKEIAAKDFRGLLPAVPVCGIDTDGCAAAYGNLARTTGYRYTYSHCHYWLEGNITNL